MLKQSDSLEFLKSQDQYSNDIIYCDPPYALGSEVIIRKDGKVDYAKAADFMNKWEMPTGAYWEKWFIEAYRTLKHGGYLIMFGMDRQLLLFKYYAHLAGFEEQQSLYWYFISNFPKATDLSKKLDSYDKFGKANTVSQRQSEMSKEGDIVKVKQTNNGLMGDMVEIDRKMNTQPESELAKKYDGYKYSISPLKQTNETIMVFQKPCKTGSPLHDTLAYENGDKTITVSAVNIDGNRVATSEKLTRDLSLNGSIPRNAVRNTSKLGAGSIDDKADELGRYPAQTLIDSSVAERLDLQSGLSKGSSSDYNFDFGNQDNPSHNITNIKSGVHFDDIGGCSKILHKCDYTEEDYDLYFYEPKVSSSERNAGCDEFDELRKCNSYTESREGMYKDRNTLVKNTHPTLKPIALNERVLKLFKTPNPQRICYAFAGAGSEIIGGIKAGFDDWVGCEISQEYVDIANARIEYWKNTMSTQTTIFDFI